VAVAVLVGLPGSGKSSVGRAVAKRLDLEYVDTDRLLKELEGRSAADLLREVGEPEFRLRELRAVRDALSRDAIVATGGGVVTTEEGRALLARERCVWLRAKPSRLLARVTHADRPLLGDDPAGALERLDRERAALYEQVSIAHVNAAAPLSVVIDSVLAILGEWEA
jgi:shikimate kinase